MNRKNLLEKLNGRASSLRRRINRKRLRVIDLREYKNLKRETI